MRIRFPRSLYARIMAPVMAVLLLALGMLACMMYISIRDDKAEARLNELSIQAHEIAYLASQRRLIDRTMEEYLYQKVSDVADEFNAGVLVLDAVGARFAAGLSDGLIPGMTLDETNAYLTEVTKTGEAIHVRTPIGRFGAAAFTVVVPWKQAGFVMGAVFIHTSAQVIQASYQDVLSRLALALALAAALAGGLMLLVTRGITRPVSRMAQAAEHISHGEFDTEIPEHGDDEIGRLALSFNAMTRDLKNLEEMRRAFVSDVSHELRSPLTSMQGFLQGMLDGTIPPEDFSPYLTRVLDETRRMNRLVSALLELSRIESGTIPLNVTRFDINELIRVILIRMEQQIEARELEVDVQFRQEPCFVNADSEQIDQVLTNLIDNAIKYGHQSGVLTIITEAAAQTSRITVADDGPGIPEQELPYIFDRFHTVDKARTSGRGTGLGLAIVMRLLRLHNQEISVSSTVGKGSSFTFTLPMAGN
ncbi:two-component sensor histidine kinase [Clostridia bacterium]|nr:two-component sensor histidine kinase [Clostridia bacterium]